MEGKGKRSVVGCQKAHSPAEEEDTVLSETEIVELKREDK
jgi:hypothetical protein